MLEVFNTYRDINELDGDIINGTLPQALLFLGNSNTAKLLSALYLVRRLNCRDSFASNFSTTRNYNCSCQGCKNFFSNFVILGNKQHNIQKYHELYNSKYIPFDFLHDNVNLFLKRVELFNKEKKDLEAIDRIKLYLVSKGTDPKYKDTFLKDVEYLDKTFIAKNVSVDVIKSAISFIRNKNQSTLCKFLIIEHIESLSVNALNLLLKTTEEPMSDSIIIFTSNDKNKVLQTILSRVRLYQFKTLKDNIQKEIIFEKYHANSVNFFEFFLNPDEKKVLDLSNLYYLVLKGEKPFLKNEYNIEKQYVSLFLSSLLKNLKVDFLNIDSVYKSDVLYRLLNKEIVSNKIYNISFSSVLENVLLKFKQHGV